MSNYIKYKRFSGFDSHYLFGGQYLFEIIFRNLHSLTFNIDVQSKGEGSKKEKKYNKF